MLPNLATEPTQRPSPYLKCESWPGMRLSSIDSIGVEPPRQDVKRRASPTGDSDGSRKGSSQEGRSGNASQSAGAGVHPVTGDIIRKRIRHIGELFVSM